MDKRLKSYRDEHTVQLFEKDKVSFKPEMIGQRYCMGCMKSYVATSQQCPFCGFPADSTVENGNFIIPGTVINEQYLIGKSLDYDGYTVIYIAKDCLTGQRVMVTEYLPSFIAYRRSEDGIVAPFSDAKSNDYEIGISGFIEDAISVSSMKCNEIVRILDIFEENGTAYIVTEYIEGVSLEEYLEGNMCLTYQDSIGVIRQLLDTLGYIHEIGMQGFGLAPRNIYLNNAGGIKLLNRSFGKSSLAECYRYNDGIADDGYAPEEMYGDLKRIDERADVYGLAAVILRMLTGVTPVNSLERRIKLETTGKDPIRQQLNLLKDMLKGQINALANALNIDAEDRTASVSDFAEEFLYCESVKLRKVTVKSGGDPKSIVFMKALALLSLVFMLSTVAISIIGNQNTELVNFKSYSVPIDDVCVPNVVSKNLTDVQKSLDKLGLNIVIAYKKQSNSINADTVVSQFPDVGSLVPYGSSIELVLSAGSRKESVGDFTGFGVDSARFILETCGFKVTTREESNSLYARGVVFYQSVASGELLDAGSEITLTVSNGNESVATSQEIYIPNIVGKKYDEVLETMRQGAMFLAISGFTYDSAVGDGVVTYQYPNAGESGHAGEIINVKVNKTQNKTVVPNVMYLSVDDAKAMLEANGLEVDVKYNSSSAVAAGAVIDQSVSGGESVDSGEKITLTVSSFYSTDVPNVENMAYYEAREVLRKSGFSCSIDGYTATISEDAVVETQNIKPNTSVEAGTNIILTLKESK